MPVIKVSLVTINCQGITMFHGGRWADGHVSDVVNAAVISSCPS